MGKNCHHSYQKHLSKEVILGTKVSVGDVAVDLKLNQNSFDSAVKSAVKSTETSFKNSMKKVGTFIASAFAIKEVANFTKTTIDAASEIQSAWTGLNSIVQGTGNSFGVAQEFISDYTKDGLVSVNEAVTSYKNLLSRGYDTSQIEGTLNALKDSASFGRQASYDLGEAVVTATEGLKNENSILVDNAGVTKNVAKMWDEYAASIGKTSNNLTQAEKIQAEYKGIMQETKFQTGDAITYANTFAGQMQRLSASFTALKVAVGRVVTPIAQLFIPVINGAVNALTNLFNGIYKVLNLFGLEFKEVITKNSNSVSDFTSNIASAGDTAVKAAKKVSKAFSDVDEINVIKTSESTSSNSSDNNNGASSNVSIVPTVATDNAVSSAVDATVSKIQKYIEPLKNISFDNLVVSFKNLWNALKPFGKTIGSGLEWLYFNVLVPLAKWTIEDVLPSFINILAGAFKVINPILESFGNIFEPIWKNLLNPLAKWTGGIVVSVLKKIGDALSNIGDWMSNNQDVIDKIVFSLGIFFGLWKVTELMAFIQMAGGISGVFKLLTSDIWANIAAKIADKAETIILTGLYAKDFLASLVQGTAALVKQAAQWVITTGAKVADTAATTAATAATWLFNTALTVLTSPITLVVIAITALITIVLLLVKHWDDVKEAASKCWEWIVGVWNAASEWFNSTIVQPISNLFSGMWDNLKNGASSAWEGIKSVFSSVGSFFKTTFTNAWTAVKNIFSTGGKIFDGIKDGIVSSFKTIVNGIISGINKVVAVPFNGINTALKKIKNISIAGIKPFDWLSTINVPQIPKLARGGYVDRNNPQLAIVGDNTREGEIITPESKIYDQVNKAIKDNGGVGKQQIEIVIYHKYEDGKTIIQKINQEQIEAGEILLLT